MNATLAKFESYTKRQAEVHGGASAPVHTASDDDAARRRLQKLLADGGLLLVLPVGSGRQVKNPLQLRGMLRHVETP